MKRMFILGLAAASFAAAAAPQPAASPASSVSLPATDDISKPITPVAGPAAEALAKTQATTQAHNAALMSRRNQCVKLVRQGVVKPTATAQLGCILKGVPVSE